MKFSLIIIVSIFLPLTLFAQNILINEVMSSNSNSIADADGDFGDWIELYNADTSDINLLGFGLSDDATNPYRWVFPEVILLPGEYILVWASGKDRSDEPDNLHTNFSISQDGEELVLVSPDSVTLDYLPPIEIPTDISYGRYPDGGIAWYFFDRPTPGVSNNSPGFGEILPAPVFSHSSGFYTDGFSLSIYAADSVSRIYYTLDGSVPNDSSYLYGSELEILDRSDEQNSISEIPTNIDYNWVPPGGPVKKATIVRARAYRDGYLPSETVSATFIIDELGSDRFTLPVISLITEPDNLFSDVTGIYVPGVNYIPSPGSPWHQQGNFTQRGDEWERPVRIDFFESDGALALSQNAGMRIHGGATRALPQKSLRLYARSGYGESSFNYRFFQDRETSLFKRIVLRNGGNDWSSTMFRDAVLQRLARSLRLDYQSYRPSVVLINGEYWGLHNIRERVDSYYIESHYGIPSDEIDLLTFNGEVIEGDAMHYNALLTFITDHDIGKPEHFEHLSTMMDIENYLTYFAYNIYIGNIDWPGNNIYYWRPRTPDGRWRWIVYDTDFSFGLLEGPDSYTQNTLALALDDDGPGWPNPPWSNLIFRRLLTNEKARRYFKNRLADMVNTVFHPLHVLSIIEEMESAIEPEMEEHLHRWIPDKPVNAWRLDMANLKTYALGRPAHMRHHMLTAFNLPDIATITLHTSDSRHGKIRINTLDITSDLPGHVEPEQPYPWSGVYFQDIPVRLVVSPVPGYRFIGWNDGQTGEDTLYITLTGDTVLTAHFEFDDQFGGDEMNPEAYLLSAGPYVFNFWDPEEPEGSYPPSMRFLQTRMSDPGLDDEMTDPYHIPFTDETDNEYHADDQDKIGFPYKLTGRTRINGLGNEGISFINTGRERDLGAAVLALNTLGLEDLYLSFTAGTLIPNDRIYALRLQYRIGTNGPFHDVPDITDEPVEYVRSEEEGHFQLFGPVRLPAELNDKPYVQVRWKYYHVSGSSGPRAMLRLDNIIVSIGKPADRMNPEPHILSEGSYVFDFWNSEEPEGSFPPNMVFQQSRINDPGLSDEMTDPYHIPVITETDNEYHEDDQDKIGFPYKLTGRTRINGLGEDGIALINTGRGRDLGAVVLALNTTGTKGITVHWTGGTVIPNSREYAIRLQYRIGTTQPFNDILLEGEPVEYVRNHTAGHTHDFGPIVLPAELNDYPYIQLRWKYYFTGERIDPEVGMRDMLRLDNIIVTGILTGIELPDQIPESYSVSQNYPNPFNPSTTIAFGVPERSTVRLEVFNSIGQRVAILVTGDYDAGLHSVVWQIQNQGLPSGVYFYRLEAKSLSNPSERFTEIRPMMFIK
jgi:hypothetical protein